MKKPLAWHKECLKNAQDHWERELARIDAAELRLVKDREICGEQLKHQMEYAAQINEAVRRGLDAFDRSTFGKSRKERK